MLEKIYTIPVNEAFEAADGCPFCALFRKLEANELDLILGASMMEPDVRQVTNKKGFCHDHFRKLHKVGKKLPFALMMESHVAEVRKALTPPALSLKDRGESVSDAAKALAESCYICDRVEFHFAKMLSTACLLYDQDADFRKKLQNQPFFCPEHYARYLKTAKVSMPKKRYADFVSDVRAVEESYLEKLNDRISRLCQKCDYRYAGEEWGDEKSAMEDTLAFFGVDTGEKKK